MNLLKTTFVVSLFAVLLLSGCSGFPLFLFSPVTAGFDPPPTADFSVQMSSADVGRKIEEYFSSRDAVIRIATSRNGEYVTEYTQYSGEPHGILRRRWREQTRYQIFVRPSFSNSSNETIVVVNEETQQRPNDKYPWDEEPAISRPERAIKLSVQLQKVLRITDPAPVTQPPTRP